MVKPKAESATLASYLSRDEEVPNMRNKCSLLKRTMYILPVLKLQNFSAPNLFVERDETNSLAAQNNTTVSGGHIITTLLDEQQELNLRREKGDLRRAQTKRFIHNRIGYVFLHMMWRTSPSNRMP